MDFKDYFSLFHFECVLGKCLIPKILWRHMPPLPTSDIHLWVHILKSQEVFFTFYKTIGQGNVRDWARFYEINYLLQKMQF